MKDKKPSYSSMCKKRGNIAKGVSKGHKKKPKKRNSSKRSYLA